MAPAAASALMDELVEQILLRIPPDDPKSLLRAALVCKRWGRIVSSPSFRRRFAEFHGTPPPMLGFLCSGAPWGPRGPRTSFVSTTSFRPSPARLNYRTIDARHGRVLLHAASWNLERKLWDDSLVVWDPITGGERAVLPLLPRSRTSRYQDFNCSNNGTWNAAVLCASAAADACDHLDCRSGPFQVVFVSRGRRWARAGMCALVYSSEAAAWSRIYTLRVDERIPLLPSVLAGNSIYFLGRKSVLKFDLAAREMSLIDLPQEIFGQPLLRTTEDGGLGLATVCSESDGLYLWSREVGPHEGVGWAQNKVIKLTDLLRAEHVIADEPLGSLRLTGTAHGLDVILVSTSVGVFTIHLKSSRVTKVFKDRMDTDSFTFPYMSFYTPGTSHWEWLPLPSDQEQALQMSDEHKILHCAALSVKVKRDHGCGY